MIANSQPNESLYVGYNPIVDRVTDRNASLDADELFAVDDEIAVKQARVVECLQLEQAARKSGDATQAMAVGTLTDKAVDGVLKAKQIGAAIHNAGTVWTDHKAKQFVARIIALLEMSLIDQPKILRMIMEQLEGVRRSFATVEGSVYTPDQDMRMMDDSVPCRP